MQLTLNAIRLQLVKLRQAPMKHTRYLALMVCGLALAMATTLVAQTPQDGFVKVVNLHGNARYMTAPGGTWQPIKIGLVLKPGAIVQTASGSYVDLVLNN